MKQKIQKCLSVKQYFLLKKLKNHYSNKKVYLNDFIRFMNSSFEYNLSQKNIEARIIMNYHSIEKGMTNRKVRFGFGKKAISNLIENLIYYNKEFASIPSSSYRAGIDILKKYIQLHELSNYDVLDLKKQLENLIEYDNLTESYKDEITDTEIYNLKNVDFFHFSSARHSIRDFSEKLIEQTELLKALKIADSTPSACNRQPWRVYIFQNRKTINEVLKIQKGLNNYGENLSTLLLVTCDFSYVQGINERNQPYIDSGMYSMNLLYSLQYMGFACCALNASLSEKDEHELREIAQLSSNEGLTMFIAVGYPNKINKITNSPSKNTDEYVRFIDKERSEQI